MPFWIGCVFGCRSGILTLHAGVRERQTEREREREIWMCTNAGVFRKSPLDGRQFGDDIILGKINTSGSPCLVLYTSGHSKFKLRYLWITMCVRHMPLTGARATKQPSPLALRSYVPKTAKDIPPILEPLDPVSREVTFMPSKTPYDPRHMLAGGDIAALPFLPVPSS